jgi:peptidoglycan/LPS O-acetylase OafA/YrhL
LLPGGISTEATIGSRPRFGELDGLRGLAALSVVLAHFNPAPLTPSRSVFHGFFEVLEQLSLANLGVVFFYALSAFLLTYLGVREFDAHGAFGIGRFYLRRTFRIWPLYFAILAVIYVVSGPGSLLAVAYSLDSVQWAWMRAHIWYFVGFLSNWSLTFNHVAGHIDHSFPPLAILWSIAVEEQFYLLFPFLLYAALRSTRHLRVVAIGLVTMGILFRLGFRYIPVDSRTLGPTGGMYYATLAYSDVFLAGSVAGWVVARGLGPSNGWLKIVQWRGTGTLLFLAMLLLSVTWRGQLWYPYAAYSTILYGVTGVLFAAVILWTLLSSRGLASRFLRSAPMRTLGVLSYGIYLWHPIGAALVKSDLGTLVPIKQETVDFLSVISFWSYLAATVVGAALTYIIIERPFLRVKDRFAPGHRALRAKPETAFDLKWVLLLAGASMCVLLMGEAAIRLHLGVLARTRLASVLPVTREVVHLQDTKGMTALFFSRLQDIPFDRPSAVLGGGAPMGDGRPILVGDTGDLFLIRTNGQIARVVAQEGQRIRISNLGRWDDTTSSLQGLDAVAEEGHWNVDASGLAPLNHNNVLQEGDEKTPVPGYWISPSDASYTIKRMVDGSGGFVRITATRATPYLAVTGRDPLPTLNGVPVSVRGQVRAHSGAARMVLTLFESASKGGPSKSYRTEVEPVERWRTLVVAAQRFDADPGDNFSVGLVDVEAGDWFDIRELSVFKGIVP